ncbi:MAG: hypothetical protein H6751_13775 [Candidatus Omnitrophica bacterium]|nr:hypothetical protein [Candidatus Omnitrophota bacterium]
MLAAQMRLRLLSLLAIVVAIGSAPPSMAQDLSFTLIEVKVGNTRGQRGVLSRDGTQIGYDILDKFYVYDIAAGQIVASATPGVDQNGGAFNWFDGTRFALESTPRFEVFSLLTGESLSLIPRTDFPAVGARVTTFRPVITTSQIGYWVFDGDESVRGLYLNDQRIIDPLIVDPEVTVNEGVYEGFKDAAFTEEGIAYVVDFTPGFNTGSRGRILYTADTSGEGRKRIYDVTGIGKKYSDIDSVRLSGADNVAFYVRNGFGEEAILVSFGGAEPLVVADTDTEIPGGGGEKFQSFSDYEIDGDDVVFRGTGPSGDGLYLSEFGLLRKILAEGDSLEGKVVSNVSTLSHQPIANGRILFRISFEGVFIGQEVLVDYKSPAPPTSTPTPTIEGPTPTPTSVAKPDLTIQKTAENNFQGDQIPTDFLCNNFGIFTIVVSNLGEGPTTGPITVVDQLPAGITFKEFSGEGWTCEVDGQTVTCTRNAPLSHEVPFTTEFRIGAMVGEEAFPSVQNNVTVSTPGETNTANNASTVVASVGKPDIEVILVSPRDGETFFPGTRVQAAVKTIGPDPNRLIVATAGEWDGGPAYQGSGSFAFPRPLSSLADWATRFPEIPIGFPANQTIEFGVSVIDGSFIRSKGDSVEVTVKAAPDPPEVHFDSPSEGQVFVGSSTGDGLTIGAVARIKADGGVAIYEGEITSQQVDLEPFQDFLGAKPFVLTTNQRSHPTLMMLYLEFQIGGDLFGQLFTGNDVPVSINVGVLDELVGGGGDGVQVIVSPETLKQSILTGASNTKGNNTVDSESRIVGGLVTNSEIEKSLIVDSTVTNSTIRSSVLLPGVIASDAVIDFGVVLSGTVSRDGTTLVAPSLLADLYDLDQAGHVLSTSIPGDLDNDGQVTSADRLGIAAEWRRDSKVFDLNLNNQVDPEDLLGLIELWRY